MRSPLRSLSLIATFLFTAAAARAAARPLPAPPPPAADEATGVATEESERGDADFEDTAARLRAEPDLSPLLFPLLVPQLIGSHGSTGNALLDVVLGAAELGTFIALNEVALEETTPGPAEDHWAQALERRAGTREASEGFAQSDPSDDPPPAASRRARRVLRRHEARQGFLFSFGFGAGSLHLSPDQSSGAFDLGLRMGYGFSDRFQSFLDLTADATSYGDGRDATSWTFTWRAQTVLAGDRSGNGLNLNAGVGLGGVTRGYSGYYGRDDSAVGLALAAGLSYDARLGRSFSLSPELYATWHSVPNYRYPSDLATAVGLRINFLWYAP